MKSSIIILRSFRLFLLFVLLSCNTNPIDKIQGVYSGDKNSLKETLQKDIDDNNILDSKLLKVAIENAVMEIMIQKDSVIGLIYVAGESMLINSKLFTRNDSIIIIVDDKEAYLIPAKTGLFYRMPESGVNILFVKSGQTELSERTREAIIEQLNAERESKAFEENLGKWQKGNYVDEYGHNTGKSYFYCLIRGKHENSVSLNNEVFIRASIENNRFYFEIYNSSHTTKENFPSRKFGSIRIEFPDGTIKTERIFFYNNKASESPRDRKKLIYNYLITNSGKLKLQVDLNTASDYYTDKYLFSIQSDSLVQVLK